MTITYGQVRAITHDLVLKSLADGVFNSSAGFRAFYKVREKMDGGNNIGAPVIISGQEDDTTGGWYAGAALLNDAEKDDITRAVVDWKQVYETVLIANSDILKNSGASAILKLLSSKVMIAEKRMKGRLARGVFGDGTNALAFNGLQQIIAATGDYAGLAISDIKNEAGSNAWLAQVTDISAIASGALTERHMQNALGKATEDEDRPHMAIMLQSVYNEVWNLLREHQRILADDSTFSGGGHDQKKVLIYNGIPHYIDSHMKAQSIYYVNTEYTKLVVHSQEDLKAQSFKQLEDVNAVKERMLLMGNMFCNNRARNSELSGIAVAA